MKTSGGGGDSERGRGARGAWKYYYTDSSTKLCALELVVAMDNAQKTIVTLSKKARHLRHLAVLLCEYLGGSPERRVWRAGP